MNPVAPGFVLWADTLHGARRDVSGNNVLAIPGVDAAQHAR
jgi:hypothetical protein